MTRDQRQERGGYPAGDRTVSELPPPPPSVTTEPVTEAEARADERERIAGDAERCDAVWQDPATGEWRSYAHRIEHLEEFQA